MRLQPLSTNGSFAESTATVSMPFALSAGSCARYGGAWFAWHEGCGRAGGRENAG